MIGGGCGGKLGSCRTKKETAETLGILDSCIFKKAGVGKKTGWLHSQKKKME